MKLGAAVFEWALGEERAVVVGHDWGRRGRMDNSEITGCAIVTPALFRLSSLYVAAYDTIFTDVLRSSIPSSPKT
jgi:hypothetical protein